MNYRLVARTIASTLSAMTVILGLALLRAGIARAPGDRDLKLGTSTPRADPSGDYAWEVFRKADAIRPGAFATLSHKALQLTGAPSSVTAPSSYRRLCRRPAWCWRRRASPCCSINRPPRG